MDKTTKNILSLTLQTIGEISIIFVAAATGAVMGSGRIVNGIEGILALIGVFIGLVLKEMAIRLKELK